MMHLIQFFFFFLKFLSFQSGFTCKEMRMIKIEMKINEDKNDILSILLTKYCLKFLS